VHFLIHLLRGLRQAILDDKAADYSRQFFIDYYRDAEGGIPDWIKNALAEVNIPI
jgi:queuine/archaeosine tRNA-ribosyltransferase